MYTKLVPVTKYNKKIKSLSFLKRINIDYPLLCQDEVAQRLAAVAQALPTNYFLQIDSAYRTRKTQEILFKNRAKTMPGLVYDPNSGIPPHCTGGAVDVTLLDVNGNELNLSEPFAKYYDEPSLYSTNITPEAQKLRLLLNNLMLSQGFAPHPDEYWHFSYGDKVWSTYYSKPVLYGEYELEAGMYYPPLKIVFMRVFKKLWQIYIRLTKQPTSY